MDRQTILQIWFNAYLEGDREAFAQAESILCKMDKGMTLEEIKNEQ